MYLNYACCLHTCILAIPDSKKTLRKCLIIYDQKCSSNSFVTVSKSIIKIRVIILMAILLMKVHVIYFVRSLYNGCEQKLFCLAEINCCIDIYNVQLTAVRLRLDQSPMRSRVCYSSTHSMPHLSTILSDIISISYAI